MSINSVVILSVNTKCLKKHTVIPGIAEHLDMIEDSYINHKN